MRMKKSDLRAKLAALIAETQSIELSAVEDTTRVEYPAFRKWRDWLRENKQLREQEFYWQKSLTVITSMQLYSSATDRRTTDSGETVH